MAWIESHQGLARHIKTKRLARKLDVSVPAAIGHLHLLWWWSMDNTPDGNLSQLEPDDIADEMMWNGDSDVLVRGLVDSGFVDEVEGSLVIHDFYDYVGKLVDKRKADAERKRMERSKSKGSKADVREMSNGRGLDDPSDGAGNSTVQYLTELNNIYSHWNTKKIIVHKEFPETMKGVVKARLEVHGPDALISAIDNYSEILNSETHYYSHKFTLKEFMNPKNVDKFLTENDPFKTFLKNQLTPIISDNRTSIPDWKKKEIAQKAYENMEIARNKWINKGNDPDAFVYDPDTEY